MNDRPGTWPDNNGQAGDAQERRVVSGQVWQRGSPYPIQVSSGPPLNTSAVTSGHTGTSYGAVGYTDLPYEALYGAPGYTGTSNAPPAPGYTDTSNVPSAPGYTDTSNVPPAPEYASIPRPRNGRTVPQSDRRTVPQDVGGHNRSTRPPWVPPSRGRRIARRVAVLLCALLVLGGGTYVWAEFELERSVDLGKVKDRPPPGKGTTYLIVGSDSRDGLSEEEKKDLHTGAGAGGRTDSMMLLHTGAHGTTMVSLPRDSWVTLPEFVRPETGKVHRAQKDKLNAAYSMGGPRLLVQTIEHNTGLRIDHYTEIGFGGFVGVVNAVGGVEMCVDRNIKDKRSDLDLTKGCHNLDGAQSLAFVRQRHQEAEGDLGRSKNQQKFLSALARKAAAPGTALNPLRAYPALDAGLGTLVVDKDMDLRTLVSLFQGMRGVASGQGTQLNVPVAGEFRTSKGDAVKWDERKAQKLFDELRNDRPVSIEEQG